MKKRIIFSGTKTLVIVILSAMMMTAMYSCKKESLEQKNWVEEERMGESKEELYSNKKPKSSPNFGKERLICQFGNWAGDWLNYEYGDASKKFDMTVLDTSEIEVSSKWDTGKGCYALDTNAQRWLYTSMSDSVNDAINKVNLNGLVNPFVVAVEILKPDYSVLPPKDKVYQASFMKGELDTIYYTPSFNYKFRVITIIGGKVTGALASVKAGGCWFLNGSYAWQWSAPYALSVKANSCSPTCGGYYVNVEVKGFGYGYGIPITQPCSLKQYLYEYFDNPHIPLACSTIFPGNVPATYMMTFNTTQMNFLLTQGINLAAIYKPVGKHTFGYRWWGEFQPFTSTMDGGWLHCYHRMIVNYGNCRNIPPNN